MKTIVIALLAISFVVCMFLASAAFARARSKGRFYSFPILCASAGFFAIFYLAELLQPDLRSVLFCIAFEYVGMVTVAVSMFFVIRDFAGKERSSPMLLVLVSIVPAITVAIAFTVTMHELLYVSPSIANVAGLTILSFGKGPWYWVNILFIYGVFIYGAIVFITTARYGTAKRRAQAGYMLAGSFAPILANIIYLLGLTPAHTDPTPIAFAVAGALYSAGFFRYRLFDIQPLARDLVFGQMRDAALVVEENGTILDYNVAAETLFPALGMRSADMRIETIFAACSDVAIPEASHSGHARIAAIPGARDEKRFETRRSAIRGKGERLIGEVYTFIDVTEREILLEKLEELASIDELTRVPNRRRFYELAAIELGRAQRHGRSIGFAIMDMNGFKRINDRFGHKAGDDALKITARLCVDAVRSCDIVGRIGGDEFAFIFPECDEAGAATAADKIRRVICAATFASGSEFVVLSASVGSVGSSPPIKSDVEEFMSIADKRMYADKTRSVKA